MRYLIKVVLLLLVLSFAGAGMPLYMDTIDLNRETSAAETPEDLPLFEFEHQVLSGEQHQIDVSIDLRGFESVEAGDMIDPFSLEIYAGDDFIKKINTAEVDIRTDLVEIDDSIVALTGSIMFEQRSLDLPDGDYRLKIIPKVDTLLLPQEEINLSFSSTSHYEPASYESASNQTPLRLFFPDESSRFLIPVTRFVPKTNTTLRETVRQLEAGPLSSMGLFNRSPIPPVPRIQLAGGTASLYLTGQLGFYNEYPNVARMASQSLVESLGHIPEVSNIQFYFDNRIVPDGFRGVATDTRIEPLNGPFIYAAYRAPNSRLLLLPMPFEEESVTVPALFDGLVYHHNPELYGYELQPAVPHDVELLNYTLENGVLVMNVNRAFELFFSQNPGHGKLMLDALVLTMTSMQQIEKVLIQVEGQIPSLDLDRSLAEPLERPPFINPET